MNFLEFAAWGAYLTSMGTYLVTIGMATQIGWFYAIQGIVSIFMPALMGIVATIGTLSAQAVVNAYTVDGVTQWAACVRLRRLRPRGGRRICADIPTQNKKAQ